MSGEKKRERTLLIVFPFRYTERVLSVLKGGPFQIFSYLKKMCFHTAILIGRITAVENVKR